jgi:hypothetical protein
MTLSGDPRDMARLPSPALVDRLLSGDVAPDDLPDESAPLARLLAGMRALPAADAFTERRIVSEMAAAIVGDSTASRGAVRGRRLSAKAGALAFVAVLATGTAAAAANGSLPPSIQRAVSDALSHVAINVPHPGTHHDNSPKSHHGGPDGRSNGGVAPGSAKQPVAPRGVDNGKDGDKTPRGTTNAPGVTTTVPHDNNGRPVGPPTSVPQSPGTTNPNQGSGNNSGNHTGSGNGNGTGTNSGNHTGTGNGNANGTGNGNGNGNTTRTTPTTVKQNDNQQQNSNAGGNGNGPADSHASLEVSGLHVNGYAQLP